MSSNESKSRMTVQQRYNLERQKDRRIVDKIKKSNPPLRQKVTMSTTVNMNRSSSGIGGLLDGLKAKIDILDQGQSVLLDIMLCSIEWIVCLRD